MSPWSSSASPVRQGASMVRRVRVSTANKSKYRSLCAFSLHTKEKKLVNRVLACIDSYVRTGAGLPECEERAVEAVAGVLHQRHAHVVVDTLLGREAVPVQRDLARRPVHEVIGEYLALSEAFCQGYVAGGVRGDGTLLRGDRTALRLNPRKNTNTKPLQNPTALLGQTR